MGKKVIKTTKGHDKAMKMNISPSKVFKGNFLG